jgi:hypothetical protein
MVINLLLLLLCIYLFKEGTNPTPYSQYRISEKKTTPPTQPCALVNLYSNMKLLKNP